MSDATQAGTAPMSNGWEPSPEFRRMLAALRRHPMTFESVPLATARALFDASSPPVADDVLVVPDRIAGLSVEVLTTPGAQTDGTVVYLHGGGYVMGSIASHRRLAGEVARASGARVVIVEYPLAPEHRFPVAINRLTELYEALLDSEVSADRLALVGDSAGGGLAVATLVNLRRRGRPMPACCVTISAFADLARTEPYDPAVAAADPVVTPQTVALTRDWYLDSADAGDELAGVVRADLTGLPPMLIQVGGAEILRDDSLLLARQARRCEVPVDLEVWPHMVHVWHMFAGRVPESTAAVHRVGDYLRDALGSRQ